MRTITWLCIEKKKLISLYLTVSGINNNMNMLKNKENLFCGGGDRDNPYEVVSCTLCPQVSLKLTGVK